MKRVLAILLLTCLLSTGGCSTFTLETSGILTGGPHYYRSFAKFGIPERPMGRLSPDELATLRRAGYAYYEAFYDESGRLSMFRKRWKGEVVITWKYFYRIDEILYKRTIEFDDGEVRTDFFDESGRLIRPGE